MSMTPEELADHAERLRYLIEVKEHQVADKATKMGPACRAHLLVQLEALRGRVDEILRAAADLSAASGGPAAGVVLAGVVPGVDPLTVVVGEAQAARDLPAAPGDLRAQIGR